MSRIPEMRRQLRKQSNSLKTLELCIIGIVLIFVDNNPFSKKTTRFTISVLLYTGKILLCLYFIDKVIFVVLS